MKKLGRLRRESSVLVVAATPESPSKKRHLGMVRP